MPEAKSKRASALKKVPLFADLSDKELSFLAEHAVPHHFSAGQVVFSEGEPCEGLYIIESGALKVFKLSASGREQVLTVEGAGNSVAELPVFDGGDYPASAAALMLEHLGEPDASERIMNAPRGVTAEGRVRTPDLGGRNTTDDFAAAVVQHLTD